jgi:hypothetical protein
MVLFDHLRDVCGLVHELLNLPEQSLKIFQTHLGAVATRSEKSQIITVLKNWKIGRDEK